MSARVREFQIFAKPAGALCNLACRYCYYLKNIELYVDAGARIMPDNVLKNFIRQNIEATTDKIINFSWHGGEPMIAGIDFYRKAVALQKKYLPAGARIINGIQTNGTFVNDEWCRFFAEEGFVAGVSIDGPEEFHNKYRRTAVGNPTFNAVIRGFEQLKRYGIPAEILCVVSSANVGQPAVVYDFFRQLGAGFITFLPLVERDDTSPKKVSEATVPSLQFGHFLSTIFDEWTEKDIDRIRIQIFEEAVRPAFGLEHTLCVFRKNCGGVPVVERNGDFYSCDHFVDRDHLVGNILEKSISDMLDSSEQLFFGQNKSASLPRQCRECEVLDMCNGECPKNRFMTTPDGEYGLNYLCEGYRYFFNHFRPFADTLAALLKVNS